MLAKYKKRRTREPTNHIAPSWLLANVDEYVCSICHGIMQEAVQTSCGHRFCEECIRTWLRSSTTCPLDRQEIEETVPDLIARTKILRLVTVCRNSPECKERGVLGDGSWWSKHDSNCVYKKQTCPYCDQDLAIQARSKHWESCSKLLYLCENLCGARMLLSEMKGHMQDCQMNLVKCDLCQKDVARCLLSRHECPVAETNCLFAHMGCVTRASHEKLQKHYKDDLMYHLQLMLMYNSNVPSEFKHVNYHHAVHFGWMLEPGDPRVPVDSPSFTAFDAIWTIQYGEKDAKEEDFPLRLKCNKKRFNVCFRMGVCEPDKDELKKGTIAEHAYFFGQNSHCDVATGVYSLYDGVVLREQPLVYVQVKLFNHIYRDE